jgi:hypothetical protein
MTLEWIAVRFCMDRTGILLSELLSHLGSADCWLAALRKRLTEKSKLI